MELYPHAKGIEQTFLSQINALDNLGTSLSQVCFAAGKLAFEDNPETLIYRLYKNYSLKNSQNKISEAEFSEKYSGIDLECGPNISHEFADYLLDLKQRREKYEYIVSKARRVLCKRWQNLELK